MAKKPSPLKGRKLPQEQIDRMVAGKRAKKLAAQTGTFIPADAIPRPPKRTAVRSSPKPRAADGVALALARLLVRVLEAR